MLPYIIRRVLYMIPTVLGVILVTFVLFNVVGGSPAAMTLGQHASPKAMEDFDEQRGFNKPLFCGGWTDTRAYTDRAFNRGPGAWRGVEGATYLAPPLERSSYLSPTPQEPGRIRLSPGLFHAIPLAFPLKPATAYRWTLTYRLPRGHAAVWLGATNADAAATPQPLATLPPSERWTTVRIPFTMGARPQPLRLRADDAPLEIRALRLQRRTAHFLDSQLWFYLRQIARLDFGTSTYLNQRISDMLLAGVLPSLALAIPIFTGGLVLAIVISLLCAFYRDTWLDRGMVVLCVILMSVNYLVWIILAQYKSAYQWRLFPLWGFESWHYLMLPALVGVFSGLGSDVRFYRTIMLDEMYKDYVRLAFAKGLSQSRVLFVHVLKNAMIPILTNIVVAIPFLYTGNMLLETYFGIPGLGSMGITAINNADLDVVRAIVFIGAILYVVANLLTDLCYALVDPRVKLK